MFLDGLVSSLHQSIFRYQDVLRYLYSRHVTDDDIRTFEIGYNKVIGMPDGSGSDWIRFKKECIEKRKLEKKIIFPIKNALGYTIGLIGRSVETKEFKKFITDEGKYTGFFFGLPQALPYIYKMNFVFIVEGPFDLNALVKVFPNTVASLTSGISESQYEYLRFYCDKIITVFDADKAGRHGTEKIKEHKGVFSMDLGYKDSAKCLEILKLSAFKKYVSKKARSVPIF